MRSWTRVGKSRTAPEPRPHHKRHRLSVDILLALPLTSTSPAPPIGASESTRTPAKAGKRVVRRAKSSWLSRQ